MAGTCWVRWAVHTPPQTSRLSLGGLPLLDSSMTSSHNMAWQCENLEKPEPSSLDVVRVKAGSWNMQIRKGSGLNSE
eukprot:11443682-Alexandrium_andersonii.AAC.1